MDFALALDSGIPALTLTPATDIMNLVYTSLMIRKGAWWFNPAFGSRLYELQRGKATDRTLRLARDYAAEALQWLIDTGKATAVATDSFWETPMGAASKRMGLLVTVTQKNGTPVTFQTFVEVV